LELTIRTQRSVGYGAVPVTEQAESSRYLNMLRQCQSIWAAALEVSSEARMAYDAVASTIRRVETHLEVAQPQPMGSESPQHVPGQEPTEIPEISMSYDEAAFVDWVSLDQSL
jgi:cell wall assembly regulator SMI1